MEKDNQLKDILSNSIEGASADFTNAVMKKVNRLPAVSLLYQPLVPPRLKRLFLLTFGASIALISGLCLLIVASNLHPDNWVPNVQLPNLNYGRILIYIIVFWIIFSGNRLLEKKFFV